MKVSTLQSSPAMSLEPDDVILDQSPGILFYTLTKGSITIIQVINLSDEKSEVFPFFRPGEPDKK